MNPAEAQVALPRASLPAPVYTAGARPAYHPWASASLAAACLTTRGKALASSMTNLAQASRALLPG
eukprot:6891137-Lingulodinium_polyedra.AAC.1